VSARVERSHGRRTVMNMLTLAGGHAGSTIVLIATTPYFFGVLGPSKYGLWMLFSALVQYAAIVDFGLGPGLVKYVAEDHVRGNRQNIRVMMTFSMLFYLGVGVCTLTLLSFFGHQIVASIKMPPDLRAQAYPLLLLMAVYFFISQQTYTLHGLLSGLGRLDVSATVRAIGLIVYVLVTLVALRLGFGLNGMLLASFLVLFVSMPVLYAFAFKEFGHPYCWPKAISWPPVRRLFATGGWMQISSIMGLIYFQTNGIVIGFAVNVAAVALYDLASRLSRSLRAISFYINGALFPAMSALEARSGPAAIQKVLVDGSRYVSAISFCASGFLIACAPIIFSAWLGNRLHSLNVLVGLLIVLCLTSTIENCIAVPVTVLRAIGLPKLETAYSVAVATTNVILSILLVPRFGVIGVVFGTLLGSLIGSVVFLTSFSRIHRVPLLENFGKPILKLLATTTLSSALAWFATQLLMRYGTPSRPLAFLELAVVGSIYAATFLILLGATGFLKSSDLAFVKRLLPKRLTTPVDRRILSFLFAGR
jgi:O-antigen/teichoic acid export membrane protein